MVGTRVSFQCTCHCVLLNYFILEKTLFICQKYNDNKTSISGPVVGLEEENKNLQMFKKSKKQIKVFVPTHSNAITTQSHCVLAALLSERVSGVLLLVGASLMKGTMQRLAVPARRLKLHPGFNCCEQEEMQREGKQRTKEEGKRRRSR